MIAILLSAVFAVGRGIKFGFAVFVGFQQFNNK
jgi:hypothetical protein